MMMDGTCLNCGGNMERVNSDDERLVCDTCPMELQDGTWFYRDEDTDELIPVPDDIRLRMAAGETFEFASED